jgi:hypothetical protein
MCSFPGRYTGTVYMLLVIATKQNAHAQWSAAMSRLVSRSHSSTLFRNIMETALREMRVEEVREPLACAVAILYNSHICGNIPFS